MRLPVNYALPFAALILLSGCGQNGSELAPPPPPRNGPAADYPVVVGPAFTVGDKTYTPEDKLNYDAVGYAAVGGEGSVGVSGAHKTLPLPSYVEVTSLDSGKTILVRLERRGPMSNDLLVELSDDAAAQLGIVGMKSPVRVRRVNPPEQERALLRAGGRAPERMSTPKALLDVLTRKLGAPTLATPSPVPPPSRPVKPTVTPHPAPTSSAVATPTAISKPPAAPKPAATPAATAHGGFLVQVAAFSTKVRADGASIRLGAQVSAAGRLWRMKMGPFATRAEAEAALAKARGAGYTDARIQRID
jgi:rare lipoprotein A